MINDVQAQLQTISEQIDQQGQQVDRLCQQLDAMQKEDNAFRQDLKEKLKNIAEYFADLLQDQRDNVEKLLLNSKSTQK